MGAILATPGKCNRHEVRIQEKNNNLNNQQQQQQQQDNNNDNHHQQQQQQQQQQKPAPFTKFNIVQECFPSLAGKENKFFNEKVPSYWSKTKNEAKKKSKQKIIPTLHVNLNNAENTENVPPVVETSAAVLPEQTESTKPTAATTVTTTATKETIKISPLSSNKHYYGTLNLSETLKYIGCYVYLRCRNLEGLKPSIVVGWVRGVDRNLVLSGWQEIGFISQPNMIVLYMLLREVIPAKVRSTVQLKAIMMSTLYMCYAYNGHEISYPLKPFIFDGDRGAFWNRCMEIINCHSDKLLRANKDPKYYNEIQVELKTFGRSLERKDK